MQLHKKLISSVFYV